MPDSAIWEMQPNILVPFQRQIHDFDTLLDVGKRKCTYVLGNGKGGVGR
jgi:hypothetical protein